MMGFRKAWWVFVGLLMVQAIGIYACAGRAEDDLRDEGDAPGPCMKDTPPGICTAQLVTGGIRYLISQSIVNKETISPKDYTGYKIQVCCEGKIDIIRPNYVYV
ncbi:hypothetical protein E2C01_082294 [Portunus trituberculatus]|uniref:Vitelline membrane outer layer protein 1 n=1 Tax=Portunus trituberculatus TaxID=210409 RepID=A0A5B7IU57_PORTR|nr:hypothetical protein [Portunus trituberculatus]